MLPSFYCKVFLLTKFTMHTIHIPNNTSTQKVQTRIRLDGQMKAQRLQEGDGIPKVSVTLGQTHQEQLPLKSSFINYQRLMIQLSSRKAAKSFCKSSNCWLAVEGKDVRCLCSLPQLRSPVGLKFKSFTVQLALY